MANVQHNSLRFLLGALITVLVTPRDEARGETILYVDANASGPTRNE